MTTATGRKQSPVRRPAVPSNDVTPGQSAYVASGLGRAYHNGFMTVGAWLLIGASVLLGLGLSIFLNLLLRPTGLGRVGLAVLLVVAIGAGIAYAVLSQAPEGGTSPQAETPGAGQNATTDRTAAELAPDLRDRLVLSTDDSTGSYLLLASRFDGTNRRRVADWGGPVVGIPGSTDIIVSSYDERAGHGRIEIHTVTGDLVRVLTRPPPGYGDDSASYAARAKAVFFVRTKWQQDDRQTSSAVSSVVMRVPVDGSGPAEEVRTGKQLTTVSVDDSGRIMAGACDDPSHVGQACLVTPGRDDFTYIPGSEGTTMSDIRVSPDGTQVAYSSFATNPYGESQIFLYDIRSRRTTDASRLDGLNSQPSWARGSKNRCLLFTHDLSGSDPSIYLTCLRDEWQTARVLPIGQYPELVQP
jgi:hypothetical protein